MAYVIFGDPVFKAPVEKFQDTFNAQGPYYEYCNEQAKLIEAQNNFERLNRLVMKARPSYGFPYPHIPTAPFPIYNKAVVESRPEIFTYYGNTVFVNAKARAVLESVEPNVHQYIPVQFVNPKGGPELEPYWIVNVCTRLVATNLEFSNLKEKSNHDFANFPDGRYTTFFGAKLPCVSGPTDTKMILKVNKDVLAGRAIWAEWKLSFCFLTDAFVEALREAGIEPGYAHNDFHAEENLMTGETNETSQTAFPTGAGSGARPSESHVRYDDGQVTRMLRDIIPVFSDTYDSVRCNGGSASRGQ